MTKHFWSLSKVINGKKVCTSCGQNKPVSEFGKTRPKYTKSGLNGPCIECERVRANERNRITRYKVLRQYGGDPPICNCCKENIEEFLTVDHINGRERGNESRGGNLYRELIAKNFPEGFQILCYNCNIAKGHYGRCPHQVNLDK